MRQARRSFRSGGCRDSLSWHTRGQGSQDQKDQDDVFSFHKTDFNVSWKFLPDLNPTRWYQKKQETPTRFLFLFVCWGGVLVDREGAQKIKGGIPDGIRFFQHDHVRAIGDHLQLGIFDAGTELPVEVDWGHLVAIPGNH